MLGPPSIFLSRTRKVNNSYKSEKQLPQDPDIQDLKLYIGQWSDKFQENITILSFLADKQYETLILPINGTATPFHISTIKVEENSLLNLKEIVEFRMFHWQSKVNTFIYVSISFIPVASVNKRMRSIKKMFTSKNCKYSRWTKLYL